MNPADLRFYFPAKDAFAQLGLGLNEADTHRFARRFTCFLVLG